VSSYGQLREDFVLQPVTGKALPVYRGEVLRIVQEEEGGQCVDFNAYNLHDYKERMEVSRTRLYEGLFPKRGACVYTNPPRERAMYFILDMADGCVAETLAGSRCTAALFERMLGLEHHTNCQDTFAECVREYDLTPDDVHDSFNLWMNTGVDDNGRLVVTENTGRKGDHVDLLALFDTLAVPIVCGSADVFIVSNFRFKTVRVQVFEPSEQTLKLADELNALHNSLRNQRSPAEFRVKAIRTQRELTPDPGYVPDFVNYPLEVGTEPVRLSEEEYAAIADVRERGLLPGRTDAEIVWGGFMTWYLLTQAQGLGEIEFVFPEHLLEEA
jgi:uncharacterized protein YcgI (DUF1989 family)